MAVFALEHSQRDERVEEIPNAASMEREPGRQRRRIERAAGQFRENAELDRAEQRFRALSAAQMPR
jgi:hypothetical protein